MEKRTSKASLIVLVIVCVVYAVLCLTKHQYIRLTADTMLYFSIAEKYLAGDLQNAVNGYWGPLLAWLLTPFLYAGFSDVFAINALNLIFGVLTFIGVWILSFRFEITEKLRCIVVISLLPIVMKFSLIQPMDFLLVSLLIFYLGIVFKADYYLKTSNGVFSGVLGTLAYLTKAYAFPFFIVHFIITNMLHYFRTAVKKERKGILKNALVGFLLFFLISGAWIMVISDKYGYFTFSTMRQTNFNSPGPEAMGGGLEFGVPVFTEGFFEPPNETAFVIWEDPSYLRGKPWSAWQSWAYFKHFIRLILINIAEGLAIFESFSTLSIAILVAFLLMLCARPTNALLFPLFTIVLFSGGYVLFHFEERYVWLSNILLLLMGGQVITVLFQKSFFESGLRKNILIIFFLISFIFVPSRFIFQARKGSVDQYMHAVSVDLKAYGIKGRIASNKEAGSHEAWHKTFRLAYWLKSRYYGQRGIETSDEELVEELNKYDIDYYFFWGETKNTPRYLMDYQELIEDRIPDLRVYSLKRKSRRS